MVKRLHHLRIPWLVFWTPAATLPATTPQRTTAPGATTNKVKEPHCWFDPTVRFFMFQSELSQLSSYCVIKKLPPPTPDRCERRLFPPEQS